MKVSEHEKRILVKKRRRSPGRRGIAARMREDGITHLTPSQVRSRMYKHDLTYEEALVYQPVASHTKGRIGKQRSRWNRWTPSEDYEAKKAAMKATPHANHEKRS